MKKRFIAGAICPRCAAMDRVVMYTKAGKQYRECVSCGFKDEMRVNSPPLELETRVTQGLSPKDKSERPVRLIDPLEKP